MSTATVTSKGQITLPRDVRKALDIQTGDRIDFVPDERGGFRVVPRRLDIQTLRGRFAGRVAKPPTVEEMNEAIESEAAARSARGGASSTPAVRQPGRSR